MVEDPEHPARLVRLRAQLASDLRGAMRARDRAAMAALRSLLGAIDNAEAVTTPARSSVDPPLLGLGAAEVPRRRLDDATVDRVLYSEIADRDGAALEYRRLERHDRADRLDAEAAVLRRYLSW